MCKKLGNRIIGGRAGWRGRRNACRRVFATGGDGALDCAAEACIHLLELLGGVGASRARHPRANPGGLAGVGDGIGALRIRGRPMTREELEKRLAQNPRFRVVHEPGTGIIIPVRLGFGVAREGPSMISARAFSFETG